MIELIKIDSEEDNRSKENTNLNNTLDWWDVSYRPPDYHKKEDWFILEKDALNEKGVAIK